MCVVGVCVDFCGDIEGVVFDLGFFLGWVLDIEWGGVGLILGYWL